MNLERFSLRKAASQSRARDTVDAILEAANRVVSRDGLIGLTTNRVAEIAGVSIGSLYQYFPGKDAVLHALVQREFNRVVDANIAFIDAIDSSRLTLEQAVEGIVDQIIKSRATPWPVYRAMLESVLSIRHLRFTLENDTRVLAAVRAKLRDYCPDERALEGATFVALYAMKGVQIGMVFANRPAEDATMRAALVRALVACVSPPGGGVTDQGKQTL